MAFDLLPKDNIGDLFDRELELGELRKALKLKEKLVVVYGIRRIGKTSLVKSFLSAKEIAYVFIDLREIYFANTSMPQELIAETVLKEFATFTGRHGMDVDENRQLSNLTDVLKLVNEWCQSKKMRFLIALDEAQYLRFGNYRYDGIIAWAIDNLSNITFVLTGSEIGILRDFLRSDESDSPLYGRFKTEINLTAFNREYGKAFLSQGFKELGERITQDEIEATLDKLGGIVGWLTYYGYERCSVGLNREEALQKVLDEGSKIALDEIKSLVAKSRKRYIAILKAMAGGIGRWTDIKAFAESMVGRIPDSKFNKLLQMLVKFSLVEEKEGAYRIIDPVLEYAVKSKL